MANNPDFDYPGRNIKWGQNAGGVDIAGTYPNAITVTGLSISGSQGDILYHNATTWVVLNAGTANQVLITGGPGANPSWDSLTTLIDTVIGSTQGNILYRNSTVWTVLAPGTSGQVLQTKGSGADPIWSNWEGSPGGRLSLTSGVAVQIADASAANTLYYVPYVHDKLPIVGKDLGSGLSLALDNNSLHTGYQQSGKLFDVFIYNDSGTLRLVTGPAWTSSTSRGTGAGTTELDITTYPGLPTNKNSMTVKFDTSASTLTAAVNTALYVGTMYAITNGHCTCVMNPAAAAGGAASTMIGYWNYFNRVPVVVSNKDSTSSWNYNSTTWRAADNNSNNGISFVVGISEDSFFAEYSITCSGGASGDLQLGIGINSTTSPSSFVYASTGSNTIQTVVNLSNILSLGLQTLYPLERQVTTASSATFFGQVSSTQVMVFRVQNRF